VLADLQEFLYTGAVTTPGVTREDKVKLLSFAGHYNIPGLMAAKAWKEYASHDLCNAIRFDSHPCVTWRVCRVVCVVCVVCCVSCAVC